MDYGKHDLSPFQNLLIAYAAGDQKPLHRLIFGLDNRMADIMRSTSEMILGQMRLTWWRDILNEDIEKAPQGEPLIAQLRTLDHAIDYDVIIQIIDGWELLLQDMPWGDDHVLSYAKSRGFGVVNSLWPEFDVQNPDHRNFALAWALWDLARQDLNADISAQAFALCCEVMTDGPGIKDRTGISFKRQSRPLSILYKLMLYDIKNRKLSRNIYRPMTAARIMWHGMSGL